MNASLLFRVLLGALPIFAIASCASEEPDDLRYENLFGNMHGVPWSGGPATVRTDSARGIVVRIYEQGTEGQPCKLLLTQGRRVEITMPYVAPGWFEAPSNPGFRVEIWQDATGQSDPQSVVAIDQAAKVPGETLIGRARYGSQQSGDVIEGSFSAVVCEQLP